MAIYSACHGFVVALFFTEYKIFHLFCQHLNSIFFWRTELIFFFYCRTKGFFIVIQWIYYVNWTDLQMLTIFFFSFAKWNQTEHRFSQSQRPEKTRGREKCRKYLIQGSADANLETISLTHQIKFWTANHRNKMTGVKCSESNDCWHFIHKITHTNQDYERWERKSTVSTKSLHFVNTHSLKALPF